MSIENESHIPTKTMNVFSTDRLNVSLLFLLHTMNTFDVDLMDYLWAYTWNYFVQESSASYVISDHIVGDHIKQAIICNKYLHMLHTNIISAVLKESHQYVISH